MVQLFQRQPVVWKITVRVAMGLPSRMSLPVQTAVGLLGGLNFIFCRERISRTTVVSDIVLLIDAAADKTSGISFFMPVSCVSSNAL